MCGLPAVPHSSAICNVLLPIWPLWSKGVCGSWESCQGTGQGKIQVLWGPLKKNKYKIRCNGNISLELERSQHFTWALEIQIPFFWHLFIQFTRNAYIKNVFCLQIDLPSPYRTLHNSWISELTPTPPHKWATLKLKLQLHHEPSSGRDPVFFHCCSPIARI